jgi:arginyl-tRNA synthetase
MNVFHFFKDAVIAIIQKLIQEGHLPDGMDLNRITVDPPKEANHGDLAINAAMVLAKPAGKNHGTWQRLSPHLCVNYPK